MEGRRTSLDNTIANGKELILRGHFGSDDIHDQINKVTKEWEDVEDLAQKRMQRLKEADNLYQVCMIFIELINCF